MADRDSAQCADARAINSPRGEWSLMKI